MASPALLMLGTGGVALLAKFAGEKTPTTNDAVIPRIFIGTFAAAAFVTFLPEEIGGPMALLVFVTALFLYGPGIFKAMGLI